jgi:hypothetical protein
VIAPASVTSPLERLRVRVAGQLAAELADRLDRLSWDRERIRAHQCERLRGLLAHALANSPFHARRLAGVDPERFELADLASLPVMSKAEMMDGFDELLTDRRLSRRLVESHLDASGLEPRLLLDEYVCLSSGGSSGLRGVFVQTLDEFMQFVASVVRGPLAQINAQGGPPADGVQIGIVGAASPVHSSAWAATCSGCGSPQRPRRSRSPSRNNRQPGVARSGSLGAMRRWRCGTGRPAVLAARRRHCALRQGPDSRLSDGRLLSGF